MIIWLCSSDSLKSFHLLCSRLLYSYSQWFSNYFHHILAIEKKNFNKTLVWNSRPSVNYPKATFPALSLTALWQNLYWSQESGRLSIPRKSWVFAAFVSLLTLCLLLSWASISLYVAIELLFQCPSQLHTAS